VTPYEEKAAEVLAEIDARDTTGGCSASTGIDLIAKAIAAAVEEEYSRLYQKIVNRIGADIAGDFDLALDQLEYSIRAEERGACDLLIKSQYYRY